MDKQRRLFTSTAVLTLSIFALNAEQVLGQEICAAGVQALPYQLNGPPEWDPSDTAPGPQYERLNDPRWGAAGLTPYESALSDDRFRVAYDNEMLLVSVNTSNSISTQPVGGDAVFFGIQLGAKAYAFQISLDETSTATPGASAQVGNVKLFSKDVTDLDYASAWNTGTDYSGGAGLPNWLQFVKQWPNEQGDSAWGVNFKLDLSSGELDFPVGSQPKLFIGIAKSGDVNVTAATTPAVVPGTPAGTYLWELGGNFNYGHKNWDNWQALLPLGQACDGVRISSSNFGVSTQDDPGVLASQVPFLRPDGSLATNTMLARPQVIDTSVTDGPNQYVDATAFTVDVRFRVAKWGAQPGPVDNDFDKLGGWTTLSAGGEWRNNDTGASTYACPTNDYVTGTTTPETTCGIPIAELPLATWKPGFSHQCMLVEMRSAATDVTFANASAYKNMDFAIASTVERPATISVKGLFEQTGDSSSKEVLLYVRRKNMPRPGGTETDLPQSDMYQAKWEVTGEYDCADAEDTCVSGTCAVPCDTSPTGGPTCPQDTTYVYGGYPECWCAPANGPACAPQDIDTTLKPEQTDHERLAEDWPTLVVHAYWKTGETADLGSGPRDVLKPLTSFGLYVDHTGPLYGFTDSLVGMDGVVLTEVLDEDGDGFTDIYSLTIRNEEEVSVMTTVTAVEDGGEVPLLNITGQASSWGLIGALSVVGIASANEPLDLTTATATINALLSENGNELVSNFSGPATLATLLGATPSAATFVGAVGPVVTMTVVELPGMLGRLTTTTAAAARVSKPSGCGWFGRADLETSFQIHDATNPPLTFIAEDSWTCVPFALFN